MKEDPLCMVGKYYEKKPFLEKSKVFEMLNAMPKPAIHHLHLTAACPMRHMVELTYNDIVFFNKE